MSYVSTKCIGGHHTECVTGPDTGHTRECACDCHNLSGEAREVLTYMCESPQFRDRMMALVFQAMEREKRLVR